MCLAACRKPSTAALFSLRFVMEIEIIAIAPWQLNQVTAEIDIFHNAHSFVEMPKKTRAILCGTSNAAIVKNGTATLLSYDCFDLNTTFHPDMLPKFFPKVKFEEILSPVLDGRYGIISYSGRERTPIGLQTMTGTIMLHLREFCFARVPSKLAPCKGI